MEIAFVMQKTYIIVLQMWPPLRWKFWFREHSCILYPVFLSSLDATYSDPLGDAPARPKTAGRQRQPVDDEFADEELGDDLLPEWLHLCSHLLYSIYFVLYW